MANQNPHRTVSLMNAEELKQSLQCSNLVDSAVAAVDFATQFKVAEQAVHCFVRVVLAVLEQLGVTSELLAGIGEHESVALRLIRDPIRTKWRARTPTRSLCCQKRKAVVARQRLNWFWSTAITEYAVVEKNIVFKKTT